MWSWTWALYLQIVCFHICLHTLHTRRPVCASSRTSCDPLHAFCGQSADNAGKHFVVVPRPKIVAVPRPHRRCSAPPEIKYETLCGVWGVHYDMKVRVHMHKNIKIHTIHIYKYIKVCVCVYIYVYISNRVHMCMYLCMYMYIHMYVFT